MHEIESDSEEFDNNTFICLKHLMKNLVKCFCFGVDEIDNLLVSSYTKWILLGCLVDC